MRTAFLDGIDRKIGADPALTSAHENAKHEVSDVARVPPMLRRSWSTCSSRFSGTAWTPKGSSVGRHTEENGKSRSQPLERDACAEPTCEVGHLVAATEDVA